MVRRGQMYDDDDAYDYDDDYDEYWEEDEAYEQPAPKAAAKSATTQKGGKAAPAAAAGASPLARALCDPPPPGPKGRPQPGVKPEPVAQTKHQATYHVAPQPATSAAAAPSRTPPPGFAPLPQPTNTPVPQPFDFTTPSPDTQVLLAQSGKGPATSTNPNTNKATHSNAATASGSKASGPPPGFIHLPPSKAMLASNQPRQQAGAAGASGVNGGPSAARLGSGASVQGLEPAMASVGLGGDERNGDSSASTSGPVKPSVVNRKRMSEYSPDAALARECEAAAKAESASPASHRGPAPAPGRPGLHLVVLGHVDAGKSTLMGRLLHDLGLVAQKEVHKNQRDAAAAGKASFSWAWLLDERPEERARGVTVDVATARFATPRYNVTLLDAPGHKDFVPNMITGAAQADAALLVVDGAPGGFEAGFEGSGAAGAGHGQTREHAQLARSLGVEQLAVVITKLDLADHDPLRFAAIQSQLSPFLASCGFKDSSVQWLPAIGPTGDNLTQPPAQDSGLGSWWQGPTLVQAIDTFKSRERLTGKPTRLPVTDVFRSKAGSTVVGGKLESGALRPGTRLVVMPGGEAVTVKSIDVDGHSTSLARAGDSVEVQLSGSASFDPSHLPSGAVLCNPDYPVPMVTKFEARVLMLDIPMPLLPGRSVTVHAHVAREAGVVTALVSLLNAKTGEVVKSKPRCLLKGQSGVVEVTLERPLCLEEYSDLKALGRVALRDGGKTLAVGVVTRLID